jgi:hypothetical protein
MNTRLIVDICHVRYQAKHQMECTVQRANDFVSNPTVTLEPESIFLPQKEDALTSINNIGTMISGTPYSQK